MAIHLCPNCGKKISDRSMECPFCNLSTKAQERTDIQAERQSHIAHLTEITAAAILTIIVFLIWRFAMYGFLDKFGDTVQTGFMVANGLHIIKSIFLVTISALLFWVMPSIIKVKRDLLYTVLTVTCCLLHFAVILPGTTLVYTDLPSAELNMVTTVMSRNLIFVYGLAVPMLQGALALVGSCCNQRKMLMWKGIYAVAFEIISIIFMCCAVQFSAHVTTALGISTFAAAIAIFGAAVFMTVHKSRTT